MLRIKRTKGEAVHYATKVAANGVVEGWTEAAAKALEVDDATAHTVKEFYRRRPNAGKVECLPVEPAKTEAPKAAPTFVMGPTTPPKVETPKPAAPAAPKTK